MTHPGETAVMTRRKGKEEEREKGKTMGVVDRGVDDEIRDIKAGRQTPVVRETDKRVGVAESSCDELRDRKAGNQRPVVRELDKQIEAADSSCDKIRDIKAGKQRPVVRGLDTSRGGVDSRGGEIKDIKAGNQRPVVQNPDNHGRGTLEARKAVVDSRGGEIEDKKAGNQRPVVQTPDNHVRGEVEGKQAGNQRLASSTTAPKLKAKVRGEMWVWNRALHGEAVEIEDIDTTGVTGEMGGFTFTDGFCGIGGGRCGLELANGVCVGAFEKCEHAREVYADNWKRESLERGGEVKEVQGALGSFSYQEMPDSDVFLAGPPCGGWSVRGGRGKKAQRGKKNGLMWQMLDLVRAKQYKALVIEQVPGFARAENGKWVREMGKQLDKLGYKSWYKELYCPDFGLSQSRRRGVILAGRKDLVKIGGDIRYPEPTSERYHPLRSVLEDSYSRKDAVLSRREWDKWEQVQQRDRKALKQIGMIKGKGPGRRVYSAAGLACTQKATGKGPGWCTGVYEIHGKLSRLTLKESSRCQGFSDGFTHDHDETRARRQVGNAMPVTMIRAVGIEVGAWLMRCDESVVVKRQGKGNKEVASEGSSRNWRTVGVEAVQARHTAVMSAWQAADEIHARLEKELWWVETPAYMAASTSERGRVKRGIRQLEWYVWLRLEERKGLNAVDEWGAKWSRDMQEQERSSSRVIEIVKGERDRRGDEEAPINLFWWNWDERLRESVREGISLELRRKVQIVVKDNYESALDEKAVEMCDNMIKKGYWEGPYEDDDEEVTMTHPVSAVDKKVLLGEKEAEKRVVIDMSVTGLNEAVIATRYMLPSVDQVARNMYRGCWFKKMDMKSGFYMSTMHPVSRKLLGIRHPVTKRVWRWVRAPMGLSSSPFSYSQRIQMLVEELKEWPEFEGVNVVQNDSNCEMPRVYQTARDGGVAAGVTFFVDDGLIIARSKEKCEAAYQRLVWLFESRMGVRMCMKQSEGPVQRIHFLGLEMDSLGEDVGGPCIRLTHERKVKYVAMLKEFRKKYRRRSIVDRRELASVVGRLMFASRAVPAGKCFLYRLYRDLHPEGMGGSKRDYNRKVKVEPGGWMDLKWWEECLVESDCVHLLKTRTFALERVFTDASNYGYGMSNVRVVPGKGELPSMQFSHGVWRGEVAPFSSNWHELMTIAMSLKHSLEYLRGSVVYYVTDNNCVRAALSGTVRSAELMKIAREIKLLECKGDIRVEGLWLSGKNIIRQGADGASRASPYEGQLGDRPVDHATNTHGVAKV